jgi:hypothetical protein
LHIAGRAVDVSVQVELIVIAAPPSVLTEVISDTPEIWPNRFSNGAATVEATVAGSAPGKFAWTLIMGKSTRGMGLQAGNGTRSRPPKTGRQPATTFQPVGE